MEVRSYYATTLEAAFDLARTELGPEAFLVQSNFSSPEFAHLGRYEAVFAAESRLIPSVKAAALESRVPESEFAAILASAQASDLESPIGPDLACSPGLGRSGLLETAVAFVGPAGAGKTSTIMKLALTHGVHMARNVRLFALDPELMGSNAVLQQFAQLSNLEFREFEDFDEFSEAVEKPVSGLTLIDTAGYGRAVEDSLHRAAQRLRQHPKIETQLVLRVDRKTADNLLAMRFFSPFEPARLVLTAFDESSDYSGLASLVENSGLPVSFLGTGRQIPEDLEPSRSERLSSLIADGWLSTESTR